MTDMIFFLYLNVLKEITCTMNLSLVCDGENTNKKIKIARNV